MEYLFGSYPEMGDTFPKRGQTDSQNAYFQICYRKKVVTSYIVAGLYEYA